MGFGSVIKQARKSLHMTQDELGRKVGCTRTTVCDWEKEKYPPTDARNITALESALGFQSGELFSLIYGNPTNPAQDREAR